MDIFLVIALVILFIVSIIDMMTREVPDTISLGLVYVGISIALIHIVSHGFLFFVWAIAGAVLGFTFGYIMYISGQWGGGDVKMLSGLGALFGGYTTHDITFPLAFFGFLTLYIFLAGALYGVLYLIYAFAKSWRKVKVKRPRYHIVYTIGLIILFAFSLLFFEYPFAMVLGLFFVMILLLYLAILYSKAIETAHMIRTVPISKISEGEWIITPVIVTRKPITFYEHYCFHQKQLLKRFETYSVLLQLAKIFNIKKLAEFAKKNQPTILSVEELFNLMNKKCPALSKKDLRMSIHSKEVASFLESEFGYIADKLVLVGQGSTGIYADQIDMLKQHKIQMVTIKVGAPFLPAFFLGLIGILIFGNPFI